MSDREKSRWNQPLVIALVTASIAAVATVAAAVISSSGPSGSASAPTSTTVPYTVAATAPAATAEAATTAVSVGAVTFSHRGGAELLTVIGSVPEALSGRKVYAIAKPPAAPSTAGTQGHSQWFVSAATVPNKQGTWQASIVIAPPPAGALTVEAVEMPAALPFTSGPPPKHPVDENRQALIRSGPKAARNGGSFSKPVTAAPAG